MTHLLIACLLLAACASGPQVSTVAPQGAQAGGHRPVAEDRALSIPPGPFDLAARLKAAREGEVIQVPAGAHRITEQVVVTKTVALEGVPGAVVDCSGWKSTRGAIACIKWDRVADGAVRGLEVIGCPKDCLMVTDSRSFTFERNVFRGSGFDLILTSDTPNVKILHNRMYQRPNAAATKGHCAYVSQLGTNAQIIGNYCEGSNGAALQVNAESAKAPGYSSGVVIEGNTVRGGKHAALNLMGVRHARITGNDFESEHGVALWDEGRAGLVNKNLTVTGNRIRAKRLYAIQVNGVQDSTIGPNDTELAGKPGGVVTVKNPRNRGVVLK